MSVKVASVCSVEMISSVVIKSGLACPDLTRNKVPEETAFIIIFFLFRRLKSLPGNNLSPTVSVSFPMVLFRELFVNFKLWFDPV